MKEGLEIPYLICLACGAIGSTPFDEGDKCACGGKFALATQEYQELKKAHKELLDRAHVYGIWGPWHPAWEGSYDQRHWGEE